MKYPQYEEWAKSQILNIKPSMSDWQNMSIAETAQRALTICKIAEEKNLEVLAMYDLQHAFEALLEKYPPRRNIW